MFGVEKAINDMRFKKNESENLKIFYYNNKDLIKFLFDMNGTIFPVKNRKIYSNAI